MVNLCCKLWEVLEVFKLVHPVDNNFNRYRLYLCQAYRWEQIIIFLNLWIDSWVDKAILVCNYYSLTKCFFNLKLITVHSRDMKLICSKITLVCRNSLAKILGVSRGCTVLINSDCFCWNLFLKMLIFFLIILLSFMLYLNHIVNYFCTIVFHFFILCMYIISVNFTVS